MVRGSTGTSGFNQYGDKSAYFKDYYERNKIKLKRRRIKRIADKKREIEWLKTQGVFLHSETVKEQTKHEAKLQKETVKNYRRIRYEATKQYYVDYYQKNKHIIKQKRLDKLANI